MSMAVTDKEQPPIYCTACGKSHHEAWKMIAIQSNMFICDECVNLCVEILHAEKTEETNLVTITANELRRLRKNEFRLQHFVIWLGSLRETVTKLDQLGSEAEFNDGVSDGGTVGEVNPEVKFKPDAQTLETIKELKK